MLKRIYVSDDESSDESDSDIEMEMNTDTWDNFESKCFSSCNVIEDPKKCRKIIKKKGFITFPTVDKKSVIKRWTELKESVPIKEFSQYALLTGEHFFVLDVDKKDRGCEIFFTYCQMRKINPLTLTFTVKSQNGGYHLYFLLNRNSNDIFSRTHSKIIKLNNEVVGIDIRSNGGCICGPGSENYTIINNSDMVEVPAFLEAFLLKNWIQAGKKIYPDFDEIKGEVEYVKDMKTDDIKAEEIEKILMGLNPDRFSKFEDWMRICYSLYEYSDNKNVMNILEKVNRIKYPRAQHGESTEICKGGSGKITIGTLFYYLRIDNPELYDEIKNSYKIIITAFNYDDDYYYPDFLSDIKTTIFDSLGDLYDFVKKNSPRVMAYSVFDEGYYFKYAHKIDFKPELKYDKKTPVCGFYLVQNKKGVDEEKKIPLSNIFHRMDLGFDRVVFNKGGVIPGRERLFNAFTRITEHKIIDREDFDMLYDKNREGIEMVLSILKRSWSRNKQEYFDFIMSWFRGLITSEVNNGSAILIKSEQGMGKSSIIQFLQSYVFNDTVVYQAENLNCMKDSFNEYFVNKILFCAHDIGMTKETAGENFCKFKSYITEQKLAINEKFKNRIQAPNYVNFILFTNQEHAVILEKGDRRYFILEGDSKNANDEEFFQKYHNLSMNKEVGLLFYNILVNCRGYHGEELFTVMNTHKPPVTEEKLKLIELSASSSEKYFSELKETLALFNNNEDDDDSIEGSIIYNFLEEIKENNFRVVGNDFYHNYSRWCGENGLRPFSSTRFGMEAVKIFEKKRTKKNMVYEIRP